MLIVLTLFFMLTLFTFNSYAKEIIVCKKGCDSNTIQYAIDVSMPGDKIIVKKDVYKEHLIIDRPVTLIGENFPVIDGEFKGQVIIVNNTFGFKISGFKIQNSGMSYVDDLAGLRVENSGNCEISNNILINNFFALYLANVYNCKLIGNKILGNAKTEGSSGNGIHIWNSKNIYI